MDKLPPTAPVSSTGTIPFAWVKVTRKTETLAGQNVDTRWGPTRMIPVYYGQSNATGKISQYVRDAANALTHDLTHSNPVFLITAMSSRWNRRTTKDSDGGRRSSSDCSKRRY